MLKGIEFNDKRFRKKEYYNVLEPITKNTIILCNNYMLMDSLANEIMNTINGKAEYNDYHCDDEDVGKGKIVLSFGLQRVIDINGQKITLALEPSIIYKANSIEDIWFFDYQKANEIENLSYEEFIYPMEIFKGSYDIWNAGKDEVYKTICSGEYGTYDGNWIVLNKKIETLNFLEKCMNDINTASEEEIALLQKIYEKNYTKN